MIEPQTTIAVPLLAIVAAATWIDLSIRKIPNALSLGGTFLALLLAFHLNGVGGVGTSLLGWAACFSLFMPIYVLGGTAAGDVKLVAMVGAFLGPYNGLVAAILALTVGGGLATLALVANALGHRFDGMQVAGAARCSESLTTAKVKLEKIPYAAAIALGAAAAVLQPAWLIDILPLRGL